MNLKPASHMLVLFLLFIVLPFAFYNLGHKVASYTIAKQCAVDNSFIEHGNEFYCIDIDDYRAK